MRQSRPEEQCRFLPSIHVWIDHGVGSGTGLLKSNCRNGANLATYDISMPVAVTVTVNSTTDIFTAAGHGFTDNVKVRVSGQTMPSPVSSATDYYVVNASSGDFKLSTIVAGAAVNVSSVGSQVVVYRWNPGSPDFVDAIDDDGLAPTPENPWPSGNYCFLAETTAGDGRVWADVTTTTPPCSTSFNCRMKDQISGLEWTKQQGMYTWIQAVLACDSLSYDGKSDWRLPTQKELMSAYVNGIRSVASSAFTDATNMNAPFWSATTQASAISSAWAVTLATGASSAVPKTISNKVACVR